LVGNGEGVKRDHLLIRKALVVGYADNETEITTNCMLSNMGGGRGILNPRQGYGYTGVV